MTEPRLLGLCGSLRAASLNRKLMLEAARHFDGSFTEVSLRLPLYDGDLEDQGMPPEVLALAAAIKGADAVVIACPEYNKAPPGVVKNALDWISRVPGRAFEGKPVAILSATGGRAGGERAQYMLRWMLTPLRADVLTWPEMLLGNATKEFGPDDRLTSEIYTATLGDLMARLHSAALSARATSG
jgi:chromate reductase, NAD(P)H dehydrogenase (quinone)